MQKSDIYKHGGLDSRDQSRSRSRTSSVLRLTFSRSRFLKSRFIFVEIFIKIVEKNRDCRDCWDLSRLFKIYQDISTLSRLFEVLQDQKCLQIEKSQSRNVIKLTNSWSRNVIKLTNSRSRLRQTVEICQKCHVSTDFSVSVETFRTGRWCRDKIEISRSSRPPCLDIYYRTLTVTLTEIL